MNKHYFCMHFSESQGEEDPPSKVRAKTADTAPQTEDSIEVSAT